VKERGNLFSRMHIFAMLPILLLVLSHGASAAAPPHKPLKRILLLYSHDKTLPGQELVDKGIRSVALSDPAFEIELFHEYLDFARFEQPGYKDTLARFLGDKYSFKPPDLIISVLPQSLPYVLKHCRQIFPDVPVVACTIFENSARALEETEDRQKTTGVFFKGDIGDIVPVARRLRPGFRRIALVGGSSEGDRINSSIVRQALKPYEPDIELLDMTGCAMAEIVARVGTLPTDTVLLYTSITKDKQGQHFIPREALATISSAANVPTFSIVDSYLGYGIVGGRLLNLEAQGKKAAELAIRIFSGEAPKDIPFSDYDTTSYQFDWRELKRWRIDEAILPAGSTVQFKEISVWEEYRIQITAAAVVVLLESLLILALIRALRTSRRIQKELNTSELRYRTVADYTFHWEYWSAPDGTLNYISPACETITGYPARQFKENPSLLDAIIVPEDRAAWEQHGHSSAEMQFRIRRADGAIRWIEHCCRPVTDEGGEFLGIRASNRDITVRKQAEEKIQEREKDLHKLTGRLIWGQEEERRRLARELHDDLTQRLAVLAIQMGRMEQSVRDGRQPVLEEFQEARDQTVQISADIHAISRQLHPSILDDLGLGKAVEAECSRFAKREGIDVHCTVENLPKPLPKVAALSLYRIVQEGLANIAKHACARHAEVSLLGGLSGLSLSLRDDGIGFDATEVRKKAGLGLSSMRERVRIIQGELRIVSAPAKGTTIEVNVPLKREENPDLVRP